MKNKIHKSGHDLTAHRDAEYKTKYMTSHEMIKKAEELQVEIGKFFRNGYIGSEALRATGVLSEVLTDFIHRFHHMNQSHIERKTGPYLELLGLPVDRDFNA